MCKAPKYTVGSKKLNGVIKEIVFGKQAAY